ncbi:MAG: pirin family protein [Magnetospiraceae bacterium]
MTGAILHLLDPKIKDLGEGFQVRRVLPAFEKRSVGPFVFFDHMGPVTLPPDGGLAVPPHPHIGLSTLTWLMDGEIMHRDSLGSVQLIVPGAVNWMTAGRGIAHSERRPPAWENKETRLHGLQVWLALPSDKQEIAPAFEHVPASDIPMIDQSGVKIILVAGTGWGEESPVSVYAPTLFADVQLSDDSVLEIPAEHEERAVYVTEGAVQLDGQSLTVGQMAVLRTGATPVLSCDQAARVAIIGGRPLALHRHMYWNYVSTDKARISKAHEDWVAGRFASVIDDPAPNNMP